MGASDLIGGGIGNLMTSMGMLTPERQQLVKQFMMQWPGTSSAATTPPPPTPIPSIDQLLEHNKYGVDQPAVDDGKTGTLSAAFQGALAAVGVKLISAMFGRKTDLSLSGIFKAAGIGAAGAVMGNIVSGGENNPLLDGAMSGMSIEWLSGGRPGWGGAALAMGVPTIGRGLASFMGNIFKGIFGMDNSPGMGMGMPMPGMMPAY